MPECDVGEDSREIGYDQPWLSFAIPYSNNKFDQCFRYAPKKLSPHQSGICSADMFDNTTKIPCTEFIYASDEVNIQTEVCHRFYQVFTIFRHFSINCFSGNIFQFNIHCSDSYKLALIGTVNGLGRFMFLAFTGLLSDK